MKNALHKLSSSWSLGSIRSAVDGEVIRYGFHYKGAKPMRRCVVFVNGRSEWIEKYDFMPGLLELPDDCGFLTWDHRGQGASGGQRAYINSYDTFAGDARSVIEANVGELPYVILGHSMGGLISLYGTMKGVLAPRSLVLSAPLLRLPDVPVPSRVSRHIAAFLEWAQCGRVHSGVGADGKKEFSNNALTHSFDAFERIKNAPYKIPSVTISWVRASFEASDYVFDADNIARLAAPTLIMAGSAERVVNPYGFSAWTQYAAKHARTPIRFESIPHARHELFNETPRYRDPVIRLAKEWIADFLV